MISKDALTHQKCLQFINDCGGHIIAEHTVSESFSGDGLIVASFNPLDSDLSVKISYARAKNSLFGELENDLARQINENQSLKAMNDITIDNENFKTELGIKKYKFLRYGYSFFRQCYRRLKNILKGLQGQNSCCREIKKC